MNASRLILCTLLPLLIVSLGVAASAVVFVDANAPGPAHDGTSWQTAYRDIQSGVNDALSATKNVWVATGAYSENVAITKNNVALYGGFKPDPNDSDPFGSRTPGSSVVTPAVSSTSTFIAATGTRIDGFTIENGSADQGAAINSAGTSLIVVLCYILNNTSIKGAGIYAPGGYLSVQKCTFNNDKARDTGANPGVAEGGAIWAQNCALNVFESVFNSDVATVSNALISGPTARGGAIFASGGSGVRIDRCKFDACSATGSSLPTYYAYGGAIFIKGATAYVNSSFISNSAARGAGDRKTSYGGGIAFLNPGTINIRNNTFVGNEVVPNAGSITDTDRPYGLGAAIYTSGINTANVINNIITKCRGTAVVNDEMKMNFNYNLLWHNAGGDIFGLKFPIPNPSKGIVDGNIMRDPQLSLKIPTDFHITFGSPAKNAGYNNLAPSLDIDNEVRLPPPGGKVDIGADEFVDSDNDGGANIIDPTPND
ncbi:MAG: hypothetical protein M1133_13520, partial [Armatimonadetes bacterium]|nr:hypothetical protein [Armatimonadota bacterium]